jgi:hypothetical protein
MNEKGMRLKEEGGEEVEDEEERESRSGWMAKNHRARLHGNGNCSVDKY